MSSFEHIRKQLLNLASQDSYQATSGYLRVEEPAVQMNLLAWLKPQLADVKLYWGDKDGAGEVAMLGVCHQVTSIDAPERISEALYFGGVGFDEHTSNWSQFGHSRFVLPRLEIKRSGKHYQAVCHLDCRERSLQSEIDACLDLLDQLKPTSVLTEAKHNNPLVTRNDQPNLALWHDLIEQFFCDEQAQKVAKVVLSRKTLLTFAKPVDAWQILDQWRVQNHNCYQFAFQFSPQQIFIGCSPERLYLRSGSRLTTEALAGTTLRGENEQQDLDFADSLHKDPKLRRENTLVREDILSRLAGLSLDVGIDDATVFKLQRIQHLKQRIHAFLKAEVNDVTLLRELHPTPAVGGSPRSAALDFILAHEPYDRGWYAGAVGYLSGTQSEFSVAIRSALVESEQVSLFAGAGIVAGSQADAEWQELDNKISTVLELLC